MQLVFLLCLLSMGLNAQQAYHAENIEKYYHYRTRFETHFINAGEGAGKSIPFSARKATGGSRALLGGETTMMLGNYIAVLSTEYKLFRASRLPVEHTLQELYYCLRAVNRLDFRAESIEEQDKGKPGKLDGFLVREDISEDYLQEHAHLKMGSLEQGERRAYKDGYYVQSGKVLKVDYLDGELTKAGRGQPAYRQISQDHAIRLLWSLMLAYKCLDEDLEYGEFRDGERDMRKEVQRIFVRIVEHFKRGQDILGLWHIKQPNGKDVRAGGVIGYKAELRYAYKWMKKGELPKQKRRRTLFGAFTPIGGNDWMNDRMQLESRNLSNNPVNVWKRSCRLGYMPYFMNYGLYVHGWSLEKEQLEELKATTAFYLNLAPKEGPFYHNEEDCAPFGWACPDRTERGYEDTYLGIRLYNGGVHGHGIGNFNGLDFMLMHNLYYLNNIDELGTFPGRGRKIEGPVVVWDKVVVEREFERVGKRVETLIKRMKPACKKKCKREAVWFRQQGLKEGKSEKQCRKEYRAYKKKCRKERKEYAQGCRAGEEELRQKLRVMKARLLEGQ